jgi:hypothetical protein
VRLLQTPGLGLYLRYLAQHWSKPEVYADLSNANHGDTAAAMAVAKVARHFDLDSLATLTTKDQSVHVWQTSVCAFHNLDIASLAVCNYCKLEWLHRI